ncbi:TPA: hypothetical protein ACH3X2_013766 [Trebouxia sp. C0005]
MEEPYDYDAEALQGEQRSFLLPAGNSGSTQLTYAEQKEAKAQAAWSLATSQGIHHSDSHAIAAALHIPAQAQGGGYGSSLAQTPTDAVNAVADVKDNSD